MKKKVLSLVTAFCLCIGLSSTAFAAEMSVEEGLRPVSLNAVDSNGKEFDPDPQPQEMWLGHYDMLADVLTLEAISYCVSSPTDVMFTVSNQGGTQDCYLVVHAIDYNPMSKSAAKEQYGSDERSDDISRISGDTVYVGSTYWGGNYLCAGSVWESGSNGAADEALHIGAGQSVSFHLPGNVKDGDFCRLYVDVYYPQASGGESMFWSCYDILMDNSIVPAEEIPPTIGEKFSDVAADAYYSDPVAWAVEKGITTGTSATTFSPNNTCTTAQILTFLWRAKGSPEPSVANPFADVKDTDYYYKAALWAYENGMISGTTFGGGTPCTRSSTVTYLWKLAGQPVPQGANPFADVSGDAKAVVWAMEQGITSGTSATTFSPDATCTRAQIVTFLYRDMA